MSVGIDTNVLVVADGGSGDDACELSCLDYLDRARTRGIVIDEGYEILGEYERNIDKAGQPGAGAAFFKELASRQFDPSFVQRVTLTSLSGGSYAEFPDDPELEGFDLSDHKFVAACISARADEVAVATDSDWWKHRTPLSKHLVVNLLCPHRFRP